MNSKKTLQKTKYKRKKSRFSFHNLSGPTISIATILILMVIWIIMTETNLFNFKFIASPTEIANDFYNLWINGYQGEPLYKQILSSLTRTLVGFVLAAIIAVPLGLAIGMSKVLNAIFNPIFSFLRPIPSIAFIPLFILWFGIGETSKILLIFMSSLLYIILNTEAGVRTVPDGYIRAARNLGASHFQLFTKVIFPSTLPSIFTGLRVGFALGWTVVVAAELVAAQTGIGYMIMDASTFYRIPTVYVGVILIGIIGLVFERIFVYTEKRVCHWSGK